MSTNVINNVAFLRTSREYPEDLRQLTVEVNKSYVDIANAVNSRTIGLFPTTRPAITGDTWFLTGNQRQQTLRQVYTFTSTASINHGITNVIPGQFIDCYGSYTDGTNTMGILFGNSGGTIPNNISFYVTATQIVFQVDAGAATLTSGTVVLTWLSRP